MASSFSPRKLDLLYFIFFAIHIPTIILVDSYPLWPSHLIPTFMTTLRNYYITTYKDPFFINAPPFFTLYLVLELTYHLPLSIYGLYGLWTQHALIPMHLLIYALETGMTTGTCVVEALAVRGLTREEKGRLMGLYLPYLGVSLLMGLDMVGRLRRILNAHARTQAAEKVK